MSDEEQQPTGDTGMEARRNNSVINIGGNTATAATEWMQPDDRLLFRWLHTVCREQEWSWDEVARRTDVSSTTLYRVWTDKYRDTKGDRVPVDKLAEKVARFKRIWEARKDIPSGDVFIPTSVWERVDWLCRRAFDRQKIGLIYGESQIGKTTCAKEHTRRNNHGQTHYVEMPPAAGVQLMTKTIAKALHVSAKTSFESLIEDVVDALDENKLLIIDEVHRVFTTYQKASVMRCLDVLRYIHDQTKCGMVLCGTNVFRDQLKEGEFFQYLKQLRRRGLYELQLPSTPPRSDLDLVAKRFGLEPATGEAEDVLLHMAKQHGFGMVITRLTDAVEMATRRKRPVTWDDFIKTCNICEKMAKES